MPVVVIVHRLKTLMSGLSYSRQTLHQKLAVGGFCAEPTIPTEFTLSGRWQRRKLRP